MLVFVRLSGMFLVVVWLLFSSGCMQFRKSTSEARKEFSKKGLELKGGKVSWSEGEVNFVWTGEGDKPWICFLHGSPGGWSAFEKYLADSALLEHFRMISVDRPGFGYSNFGQPEGSLDRQSEAVFAVLDSLCVQGRIYLAGHSLGGPVVARMAMMRPADIAGVMILSGSVDPDLEPREVFRPALKRRFFRHILPTSIWVSNYEIEELMGELKRIRPDWTEIRCPVVSLHGTKDDMVPIGNADYIARHLNDSVPFRDIRLQGRGHFIPWTEMDTVKVELIKLGLGE